MVNSMGTIMMVRYFFCLVTDIFRGDLHIFFTQALTHIFQFFPDLAFAFQFFVVAVGEIPSSPAEGKIRNEICPVMNSLKCDI